MLANLSQDRLSFVVRLTCLLASPVRKCLVHRFSRGSNHLASTYSCTFFHLFLSISHLPIPHKPPSTPLQPKYSTGRGQDLACPSPSLSISLPFPFPYVPLTSHSHSLTRSFIHSPLLQAPPPPPPSGSPRLPPFFSTYRIEINKKKENGHESEAKQAREKRLRGYALSNFFTCPPTLPYPTLTH